MLKIFRSIVGLSLLLGLAILPPNAKAQTDGLIVYVNSELNIRMVNPIHYDHMGIGDKLDFLLYIKNTSGSSLTVPISVEGTIPVSYTISPQEVTIPSGESRSFRFLSGTFGQVYNGTFNLVFGSSGQASSIGYTEGSSSRAVWGQYWKRQDFVVTKSYTSSDLKLKLYRIGTPNNLEVAIQSGGTVLVSSLVPGSNTPSSEGWITTSMEYTFQPGTYSIVLSTTDKEFEWMCNESGTYQGSSYSSSDSGNSWQETKSRDYLFELIGG